ncbi:hypothetical protein CCACVL1_15822 [Corchorus capsularis]|uniref:Uncharacterized protein n=1 Tax=Corchorus capsularis TaxID=210143 RepID=A0A1R3I0Y8_COCAP|nr:hypothetical protein CCACVL1_15822 [Corchorus capsularis]
MANREGANQKRREAVASIFGMMLMSGRDMPAAD